MMDRKICAFTALLTFVLVLFSQVVYADGESLNVGYKIQSDSVSISFATVADRANVVIADSDSSLNISTTEFALIRELEKGEEGSFVNNALMPTESSSGKYYVIVTDSNGTKLTDSFWYMSESQAGEALSALSGATAENFAGLIATYYDDLGIDVTTFNANAAEITTAYIANKPAVTNKKNFLTAYSYAVLFGTAKGLEDLDEVEVLFEEYAGSVGFDMTAYNSLDEAAATEVLGKFSSGSYREGDPGSVIGQWICMADINNTENDSVDNFKYMLFEKYDEVLELDTTDYSASSNKDAIILEVIGGRPYGSKSELSTAFSSAVEDFTSSEQEDSGRGTGGSAGGGGIKSETAFPTPSADETDYSDVPETHWAYNQIKTLCEKGIISGKGAGRFYPEDNITRAEFSKIIAQTFFENSPLADIQFQDVARNAWYYEYVAKLSGKGIIMGDGNGCFNPDAKITRQDAAVIIERVCTDKGIQLPAQRESMTFSDSTEIGDYARKAIDALYTAGVINGMGNNTFMPCNNLTRAQAVQLVYVTMQKR